MQFKTYYHIVFFFVFLIYEGKQLFANSPNQNMFEVAEKDVHNVKQLKDKAFSLTSYFDGFESNIELILAQPIDSQFSFTAWVKPEELLNKNMAIVGIPDAFWLRTTTTRELQFTQPGIIDNNTANLLLSNQNWAFVSFVIDFPNVKIYRDAKLVGEFIWKGELPSWGERLFIGKDNWQQYFHGAMSNINIFTHAINCQKIKELYKVSAQEIPLTEGVVFYHSFDRKNKLYSLGEYSEAQNITFLNDSVRGKVASFNGNSCYFDFGKLPVDNAVTIAGWVKPNVFDRNFGALVSLGHAFAFRLTSGGNLLFTIPQIADISSGHQPLILNEWQHVAVSFKEKVGITFYINGQKINFIEEGNFQNVIKELKIGTNLWNDFFRGQMDDLVIWNRILSDAEIQQVYNGQEEYLSGILKKKQSSKNSVLFLTGILFLAVIIILFLWTRKIKHTIIHTNKSSQNPFLEKVNLVVGQYISDSEFSIDRFAQEVHVSKTKLYNELKKTTGKSPKEYIREQRLLKAAQFLIETDKPVNEIRFETGFESRAYFNKCFKRYFGKTPTLFRKNQL